MKGCGTASDGRGRAILILAASIAGENGRESERTTCDRQAGGCDQKDRNLRREMRETLADGR